MQSSRQSATGESLNTSIPNRTVRLLLLQLQTMGEWGTLGAEMFLAQYHSGLKSWEVDDLIERMQATIEFYEHNYWDGVSWELLGV